MWGSCTLISMPLHPPRPDAVRNHSLVANVVRIAVRPHGEVSSPPPLATPFGPGQLIALGGLIRGLPATQTLRMPIRRFQRGIGVGRQRQRGNPETAATSAADPPYRCLLRRTPRGVLSISAYHSVNGAVHAVLYGRGGHCRNTARFCWRRSPRPTGVLERGR